MYRCVHYIQNCICIYIYMYIYTHTVIYVSIRACRADPLEHILLLAIVAFAESGYRMYTCMCPPLRRGDDTVGNPHRAQIS